MDLHPPAQIERWYRDQPAAARADGVRRASLCARDRDSRQRGVSNLEIAAALGVHPATLYRWRDAIRGVPQGEWHWHLTAATSRGAPPATAPPTVPGPAWDYFSALWLRRRQPTVADCWRRTTDAAAAHGWGDIPALRTFQRAARGMSRRDVVLAREGPEALARLYPHQRRDHSVFKPGEAVSGDGLKFDRVWVSYPDGTAIQTTTAWVWQDVATGYIPAHAVGRTENIDLFRRATRALITVFTPDHAWLDNTRTAASKIMTGQQPGKRWRGRSTPADPIGLLTALDIAVHFTNPSAILGNPGAKPIERAFGVGGIHDEVANDPQLTDRGWSRATAIPIGEFEDVVNRAIRSYNRRPGRRTPLCAGQLSFRQVWLRGIADTPLRIPTEAQAAILDRIPEVVRPNRQSGEIHVRTGRGPMGPRRYWDPSLVDHIGEDLIAWIHPDALDQPITLTTIDGRHICTAAALSDVGFADTAAASDWSREKAAYVRHTKRASQARDRMSLQEAAALSPSPAPDDDVPATTVRAIFRAPRVELESAGTGTDGAQSRLLRRLAGAPTHEETP